MRGVEIFGEASSGKTEMILHLIINTIIPKKWKHLKVGGRGLGVLLIDLDCKFPMIRFLCLLEKKLEHCISISNSTTAPTTGNIIVKEFIDTCLQRFFKLDCFSMIELIVSLKSSERFLEDNPEIFLLIIDNVSSFYWSDNLSCGQSNQYISVMVKILKDIIQNYGMVVVLTRSYEEKSKYSKQSAWWELCNYRYHLQRGTEFFNNKEASICVCSMLHPTHYKVKFTWTENGLKFLT